MYLIIKPITIFSNSFNLTIIIYSHVAVVVWEDLKKILRFVWRWGDDDGVGKKRSKDKLNYFVRRILYRNHWIFVIIILLLWKALVVLSLGKQATLYPSWDLLSLFRVPWQLIPYQIAWFRQPDNRIPIRWLWESVGIVAIPVSFLLLVNFRRGRSKIIV